MPKSRTRTEITYEEWIIWIMATVLPMIGRMQANLEPLMKEGTAAGKFAVTDYNWNKKAGN
jgi:hypothetical protein